MSNANSVFSALADQSRRKILVMLSKEQMHVNEIADKFNISRPAVSRHLRILERSKLITFKKEGRQRYYKLNPKPIKAVFDWLKFYDAFWENKLSTLKTFIEES